MEIHWLLIDGRNSVHETFLNFAVLETPANVFFTKLKFVHATPNYRIGLYSILQMFSLWNPHLHLCDLWYFESFLWLSFYLPVCMEFTITLTSHSAVEFVQTSWREYCQSKHLPQWLWTGVDRPRGERGTLGTTQSWQRRRGGGVFWWGAWLLHREA